MVGKRVVGRGARRDSLGGCSGFYPSNDASHFNPLMTRIGERDRGEGVNAERFKGLDSLMTDGLSTCKFLRKSGMWHKRCIMGFIVFS